MKFHHGLLWEEAYYTCESILKNSSDSAGSGCPREAIENSLTEFGAAARFLTTAIFRSMLFLELCCSGDGRMLGRWQA